MKKASKILSVFLSLLMVISIIPMANITASATSGNEIVAYARQFIGRPYVWGAKGPDSFDCSGFVYYVFKHFGISIPASTTEVWNNLTKYGTVVASGSVSNAEAGDLIVWNGHIAIYTENGYCVEALNTKYGVCEKFKVNEHTNGMNYKVIRVYGVNNYSGPPTNAKVSVDKSCYEINEIVTFSVNTDGLINDLWIYFPDGTSATYANIGNCYQIAFDEEGHYQVLVQAWNDYGSIISDKKDFVVGPPTIAEIKTNKSSYSKNETVNFEVTTDGLINNLWIYFPDESSTSYSNIGNNYQIVFDQEGYYQALVQTWNDNGNIISEKIEFIVGPPTWAEIITDKSYYELNETVTFSINTDGLINDLWIYFPDGTSTAYANIGNSYQLAFNKDGKYQALVQTWNDGGNRISEKVEFVIQKTYTISYNANGGIGAPEGQTKNCGKALTLSGIVPTRSGYTFLGWSTSKTATNPTYQPGDSITVDSDITLYAVWQKDPVTVSSISIATKPTKTEYYVGDTFNSSGLSVKVAMSDGTIKTLTSGFTVSSPNMSTAGTKTVTVTYSGKTATFTIKVIEKPVTPDIPEEFVFSIQEPSRIEIRNKDGIVIHTVVEGELPDGARIEWSWDNNKFDVEKNDDGTLTIIARNNGETTITATVYGADGDILAKDSVVMNSKSGFFDKIGGFFRSLFGATTIYPY